VIGRRQTNDPRHTGRIAAPDTRMQHFRSNIWSTSCYAGGFQSEMRFFDRHRRMNLLRATVLLDKIL
jgi:hypothetical protein